ncbi:MAG: helix-turn-helix domain-containing protein [Clostridia bacterium]|nr:helix-turn-helix domain-containing protein [Clostridia bacterium]
MKIGEKIKARRQQLRMTLEDVGRAVGVGKSTVRKWETGDIQNMRSDKIAQLAEALQMPVMELIVAPTAAVHEPAREDASLYRPRGRPPRARSVQETPAPYRPPPSPSPELLPLSVRRIPLLGCVACGEPDFAAQEFDSYVECGSAIHADFALRAKGDSMINARIHDGDLVFVRRQDDVLDGEIAVVVLDDEVTLKRVRRKGGLTLLLAENPAYEPLVIGGEGETRAVRILGKAVALRTDIR